VSQENPAPRDLRRSITPAAERRDHLVAELPSTSALRRLFLGLGATALAPLVTVIAQVVSVPVFLYSWGPKLYGEWLLLSTIPWYMSLSDVGFGSVAGNEMTMRVAARDREGALRSFQSAWAIICLVSAALMLSVAAVTSTAPLGRWLNVQIIAGGELHGVLLLLTVYALGSLQSTLVASGFRCDGNYALGTLLINVFRLWEALGSTLAVAWSARPVTVAAVLAGIRWGGFCLMWIVLRHRSPWIVWGVRHARAASVREMASPAIAFMAFPLGNAISIQGMLVVVGVVLGPLAVTAFSTMRTLSRFAFIILETIKQSIWPELSAAFGVENWTYARKLHAKACQGSLLACACAVAFLAVFGARIYRLWTHGRVGFDPLLFKALLLVVVADSLWYASSATSIACNLHQKVALAYVFGSAASIIVAYLTLPVFGLVAAALALLAVDIPMTPYVLWSSISILRDTPRSFLRELCRAPNWRGWAGQILAPRQLSR
jgi:O-antigen/teichoic acid export membrane protein